MRVENKDIIITDPCYIIKKDTDDWEKCGYGDYMKVLGITNYFVEDTIYGDWSCTTYNSGTKEVLGKFCADAGLVGCFELDEVRAYNPDIDAWIEKHPWCVTKIPNFTGVIDTKYDSVADCLSVIGKGSTNFYTLQTGL